MRVNSQIGKTQKCYEFLRNGRGPVYSVRPTQNSENNHHSEVARFDDHSPTGQEGVLDFFR